MWLQPVFTVLSSSHHSSLHIDVVASVTTLISWLKAFLYITHRVSWQPLGKPEDCLRSIIWKKKNCSIELNYSFIHNIWTSNKSSLWEFLGLCLLARLFSARVSLLHQQLNQNCIIPQISGVIFLIMLPGTEGVEYLGLFTFIHKRLEMDPIPVFLKDIQVLFLINVCHNWLTCFWASHFPSQWWQVWGCAPVHHSPFSSRSCAHPLLTLLRDIVTLVGSPLSTANKSQSQTEAVYILTSITYHTFPLINMNGSCYIHIKVAVFEL